MPRAKIRRRENQLLCRPSRNGRPPRLRRGKGPDGHDGHGTILRPYLDREKGKETKNV